MKNNIIKKHYGDSDGVKLLSYSTGIIYAVVSNRNYGKTWTFKRRAVKRAIKHNKKTIWLRMFKKEMKETINTFFASFDLQKYCGISLYDKEYNKEGNIKQNGNTFYYRKKLKGKWTKWQWFLKVFSMNDVNTLRSADDVNIDTIIFDESAKTKKQLNYFKGDLVNDFIDIFFSLKREHEIKCILLGNKESINNPFYNYFNIKPPLPSFEGIRSYKNGSFILQQINNIEDESTPYNKRLSCLLENTSYGNYIYNSDYKGVNGVKTRKPPKDANLYVQLYINGVRLVILTLNGNYYISDKVLNSQPIYCDNLPYKYKNEKQLIKRHKQYFKGYINAVAMNHVYYKSMALYEAIQAFNTWLGI